MQTDQLLKQIDMQAGQLDREAQTDQLLKQMKRQTDQPNRLATRQTDRDMPTSKS